MLRSSGIWKAEITAIMCRYFGKYNVISSKRDYSSNMAKRNNEIGIDHPFFGLVRDVSSLLVSARSKEIEKALDDCLAKLG